MPLGPVQVTALADTSGLNPGNWTNAFTVALLPTINIFEIWHMTYKNAPVAAAARIYIHNALFSVTTAGVDGTNEWDPQTPAVLRYGDELDFAWQVAASGTAPVVTVWLRYDADLPSNRYPSSIALWDGSST